MNFAYAAASFDAAAATARVAAPDIDAFMKSSLQAAL